MNTLVHVGTLCLECSKIFFEAEVLMTLNMMVMLHGLRNALLDLLFSTVCVYSKLYLKLIVKLLH